MKNFKDEFSFITEKYKLLERGCKRGWNFVQPPKSCSFTDDDQREYRKLDVWKRHNPRDLETPLNTSTNRHGYRRNRKG